MTERDYILGTHDVEVERLALQHRVWRSRALDAWARAGFTAGQTILDVGSGPGEATLDLAEIVGPEGGVIAIERSRRFLETLRDRTSGRDLRQVRAFELDLDDDDLPAVAADGAWARWVFAFVKRPRALLQKVGEALRPGGRFVSHEYFDYATWRLIPRSAELEDFVRIVMTSWRLEGGEPDIGRDLAMWLPEAGFEIQSIRPIVEVIRPSDFMWQWPKAFIDSGTQRLVDLGRLSPNDAKALLDAFTRAGESPHTLLVTPAVLEIIAVR